MECGGRDARRKALHRRHRFRAHEEDAEVLKCVQAFQSGVALTLAAALHDAIAGFAIGVNFSGMPFVRLSACVFHRSARLEHFTLCSSRMRVIQMQGSPSRLQDGGVYVTGAMRVSLLRTEVRAPWRLRAGNPSPSLSPRGEGSEDRLPLLREERAGVRSGFGCTNGGLIAHRPRPLT